MSSNRRIIKNTLSLYVRMIATMGVALYTSRVLVDVLGIEEFGLFHVIVGFVALLGFMQGAMATATQRFFSFDLGETSGSDLNEIFNVSLQIHVFLALCITLMAATFGAWFVFTQLTIPADRVNAATWVYFFAIVGFGLTVITVPYTAMLMAHERMGAFSVGSIVDVVLKLIIAVAIQFSEGDKLTTYAFLLMGCNLATLILFASINHILFPSIRITKTWNRAKFKKMLGYTAWNTWGNLAAAMSDHGTNVLLNVFFNPTVNAAKSIASQGNNAIAQFVVNVQAALNPQIVKRYASGQIAEMHDLVLKASKFNFFILLVLALPALLCADQLLALWLVTPPKYAAQFFELSLVATLINAFSGPLMMSAQATGHIRLYHTVVGGILLLNVPVGYMLLKSGAAPETVFYVAVALCIVAFSARLVIICPLIEMRISTFALTVLPRAGLVVSISFGMERLLWLSAEPTVFSIALNTSQILCLLVPTIWLLGFSRSERRQAIDLFRVLKSRKSLT